MVTVYKIKINTLISIAFLHSNSDHVKTEIKSTVHLGGHSKENEVLRCKLKPYTISMYENADERNQRRPKYIEIHIMFMDWKTQ